MRRPSHRFPATDDIRRAIADVIAVASPAGVRVVLIGGAAMQHDGSLRRTTNVDFAADGAIGGLAEGDPLATAVRIRARSAHVARYAALTSRRRLPRPRAASRRGRSPTVASRRGLAHGYTCMIGPGVSVTPCGSATAVAR